MHLLVFPTDIKMAKASGEEKPGVDYPGDSSGTTTYQPTRYFTEILRSSFMRICMNTGFCYSVYFSSDSDRNSPDEQVGISLFVIKVKLNL